MLVEYFKAKSILDKYGIHSVESKYVDSAESAVSFSNSRKVALKVLSDKALHKSKEGLVKTSLSGRSEIASAFNELKAKADRLKLKPYKIIAQAMAENGIEIIIGGREDAQFGKVILLGLGGIYVEAFGDVSMRVCPISRYDAMEMVSELKSRKVITYNGASLKMLIELLMAVSKMLSDEEIKELDLNPVIMRMQGYDAVDLRMLK
jgi:succinyl-CoA synthetase beta subunit